MTPIGEVRRLNLGRLRERFRTWSALNIALGRNTRDATLGQIWNRNADSKSGRPREMGGTLAREIELRLGLPAGWLDTVDSPAPTGGVTAGVPVGTELVTYPGASGVRIPQLDVSASMGAGAVLPDGTRLLSQRGIGRVLGRGHGGKDWKKQDDPTEAGGGLLPFFMNANALKPYISNDLLALVTNPIHLPTPSHPTRLSPRIDGRRGATLAPRY